MIQGGAEVLGDQVGGESGFEGGLGGGEALGGVAQGFVVAGVGDQNAL